MTNLKIEDIATLEALSTDELEQVVGGGEDFQQLRELLSVIAKTDITEFTLKSDDFELTLRNDTKY